MALPLAVIAALAAAGIGAAGSLGSSAIQYFGNKGLQDDAQAFNASEAATARQFAHDEAQLARDFEAQKYQRMVADMKAAGLNPASVGGTVASGSAPLASSAAAASSGSSSISNPGLGDILSSAFNSAMLEQLKNERFVESLVERTAYHASQIDAHYFRTNTWHKNSISNTPEWFKKYKNDFESGVTDL